MNKKLYIGRNIKLDKIGFYITFNNKDSSKNTAKSHFATWDKALKQIDYMLENGHQWFNVNTDPTI